MTDEPEHREPVTVVLSWDVAHGREADFEAWARRINQAASRFPGHRGATWFRPEGAGRRYYTVVRFTDQARVEAWMDSRERRELIRQLHGVATEYRHQTTGLETWFNLPDQTAPAPARWKMVLVTFAAVYPMSLLFSGLAAPRVQMWPLVLRSLLFPLVLVPLLTYVVMPYLSRLLRRWLYRPRRPHPPAWPDSRDGG